MLQTTMTGDDWLSDRDRKSQARAEAARRKAAMTCAAKLEAAAQAVSAYLAACREHPARPGRRPAQAHRRLHGVQRLAGERVRSQAMSAPGTSWAQAWPIDQAAADAAVASTRRAHARLRQLDRQHIEWLRREAAEMRASGCEAALHDRAADYEAAADRMERVLDRESAQETAT